MWADRVLTDLPRILNLMAVALRISAAEFPPESGSSFFEPSPRKYLFCSHAPPCGKCPIARSRIARKRLERPTNNLERRDCSASKWQTKPTHWKIMSQQTNQYASGM